MNRILYTLLLYILAPFIWCYFIYRGFKDHHYLKGLQQRLGFSSLKPNKHTIHIHCASVGETLAASSLIQNINIRYPKYRLVITTSTPTGRNEVIKLLKTLNQNHHQHCYLPVDWPGSCSRFIQRISPKISLIIETEVWPNLLHQLSKKNIKSILINARLSKKSLNKYLKYDSFFKQVFSNFSVISAQYKTDKQNFLSLNISPAKIHCTGNVKFDMTLDSQLIEKQKQLKKQWSNKRPCWIAASIHPTEFEAVLSIHAQLLTHFPNLLLIAVPRHNEYFKTLKQLANNKKIEFVNRTSDINPTSHHSLVIGDTIGELTLMYGAADIAFIGGSLIERGGQNPIEPAACGLPVIIGNSYYNFKDVVNIMSQQSCIDIVTDKKDLFLILKKYYENSKIAIDKKNNLLKLFNENRGAIDKNIKLLDKIFLL